MIQDIQPADIPFFTIFCAIDSKNRDFFPSPVHSVSEPMKKSPQGKQPLKQRLRHLLPHYRRHTWHFVAGFFLLAAASATMAANPYVMKQATDRLTATDHQGLADLAAILILLALLNASLRVWSRTQIFGIGRQVEYELRREYQAKLLGLDAPFFDQQKTGDLVARGNSDILSVRMFIGPGFLQISNTFMVYAVTLPVMLTLDPTLTALTLAPFPIVLGFSRLLTVRLYRLSRTVADRFGLFSGFVQEAVAGVAVVRNHARESDWQQRFQGEVQGLYHANLDHNRLQSLFSPMVLLAGGIGGWIILAHGGSAVTAGALTIGDFVAFTGYLAILVWPTVGFGWILTVMQRGLAALERVGAVLDSQPFLSVASANPVVSAGPPEPLDIHIHNLHFAYESQTPVLSDIHMTIPAGSFIGLVGRVGSGKSALLNSLARLYPVPEGSIQLGGRDLMHWNEAELRRTLVMAPQESFLFSTTVGKNLLQGCADADMETAWVAADMAAFDDEIKRFPHGMETVVGERGITLSGGQRQRAALARALAMQPAVLLLDDVFSSVDARTEATILDNLHAHAGKRTVIMVCHRTAALHQADCIHVLDRGRIVARGRHHELLTDSVLYQDLHRQMLRAEELESLT